MMATTNNDDRERDFKEAVWQFLEAYLHGSTHDIEELVREYPEFEDQIRQKITEFQEVNTLFDFISRADESDFEDTLTSEDLVGRKIGSFEITKIIGQGGMGVVYLAYDTKLKRSVALKSVPIQLAADPTAQMRFMREAELLASLNHQNIAVIHDFIEEDKSGYLILEYVPGETLAERIAREPLKLQEALSISQQIAEAVLAAHEKGVVHRDLKPGNIKIMPDGRVKVLDFGLAKALASEVKLAETTVTQPGRVMGTPAYMSPEQARGKPTDQRTDIWSLGCIMYQMLTGRLPFEAETATDTLARVIEREPDWDNLPEDTPLNIRFLLQQCLEKDPERRLGDIKEVAVEISGTLSEPQTAPPLKLLRIAMILCIVVIGIILFGVALKFFPKKEISPSLKEIRLVVLPFENLGSTEDEYFADGITDAITARLAGINGLSVISRQSAIQYKKSEKDTPQIAKELRVDYILEGTVQRERPTDPTSKVRIIPQLINASEDSHVWTEIYDDNMSEVFRLQSDLAERVASALDITLIEPERQAIRSKPTENTEAYEYCLRGNEYIYRGYAENNIRIAIQMYEKAIELDPTFTLVYAQLSKAHVDMYWYHYDRSEQRLAMAKQAVDKALELDSDLPEVYIALGWYYYHGDLDFSHAREQFTFARKSRPNDSELLTGIGFIQRRVGKFEQAAETLEKAFEFDPLSSTIAANLGETFMLLRKYAKAGPYFDLAISLSPDWDLPHRWKAMLYILAEGRTDKARTVLRKAQEYISSPNLSFLITLITLDVYDEKYQESLDKLSELVESTDDQYFFVPNALRLAEVYSYMNKEELAKKYYDGARSILEASIKGQPEDERFHSSLGIAYAGLGRKEDAIREGKLAVQMLTISKEAMRGLSRVEDLARIYAMTGEYDAAIEQLKFLLDRPSKISIHLLRLDPAWAPLRNHPRFKKLLELNE
jgi:TolB-like protein/tetratricopeptide (TPR) repeat protein